jgi:hypothetical protein
LGPVPFFFLQKKGDEQTEMGKKTQKSAPLCKNSWLANIPGANNPWKVLKWAKKLKHLHPCANNPAPFK